ncbi:MAG: cupin domain-containing protein [Cyclobacteriaceae bacterium]|nr:cupin domain-containing protein [Cyclobacteriaceae bacterium]
MMPSSHHADYYQQRLQLTPHVEGGAFRETYRSSLILHELDSRYGGKRAASTAIYFLLRHGQFSAFHRIVSDEVWHFYDGQPLTIYELDARGECQAHRLGRNLEEGEHFQVVIKGGHWFASRCEVPGGFSLAGCTVAPGFDFQDFELASRDKLISDFPKHARLIESLTYL